MSEVNINSIITSIYHTFDGFLNEKLGSNVDIHFKNLESKYDGFRIKFNFSELYDYLNSKIQSILIFNEDKLNPDEKKCLNINDEDFGNYSGEKNFDPDKLSNNDDDFFNIIKTKIFNQIKNQFNKIFDILNLLKKKNFMF